MDILDYKFLLAIMKEDNKSLKEAYKDLCICKDYLKVLTLRIFQNIS